MKRMLTHMLCLSVLIFSHGTRAEIPENELGAYTPWMGAFWGLEFKAGLALGDAPQEDLGLGLRFATLLSLLDLELFAHNSAIAGTHGRTRLGIELKFHPLFMRTLHQDMAAWLKAGLHLAFGIAADFAYRKDAFEVAPAFSIGLGGEIPLVHPGRNDPSLWLGLGWRLRTASFSEDMRPYAKSLENEFLLSLGLRFSDLSFARFPRPSEFDRIE